VADFLRDEDGHSKELPVLFEAHGVFSITPLIQHDFWDNLQRAILILLIEFPFSNSVNTRKRLYWLVGHLTTMFQLKGLF
jgi:hypothetical protein